MPFHIQKQEENEWCWAAVSVSLAQYFNPGSALTQMQMACEVLQGAPDPNATVPLQNALTVVSTNSAKSPHPLKFPPPRGPLSFDQLVNELRARLPVSVRIKWRKGGAHFLVLWGCARYSSGAQTVEVADPLHGYGTVDFNEFSQAYRDSGQWTATYPVWL